MRAKELATNFTNYMKGLYRGQNALQLAKPMSSFRGTFWEKSFSCNS